MSRPALIAANWKMHLGRTEEALHFVRRVRASLGRVEGVEVVLCAPFPVLPALAEVLRASRVGLGAQNMHWETAGAHTGEVSPAMLAGICDYVILGHSERRAAGGSSEDDDAIRRKLEAAVSHGLTPILCVGESAGQRAAGETGARVTAQLSRALAGVDAERAGRCVIAYEPIWAIGAGQSATPAEANRTVALAVRGTLSRQFGDETARSVRVLYGGSVNTDNVAAFLSMPEIDGALVGGASLEPGFVELVRRAAAVV